MTDHQFEEFKQQLNKRLDDQDKTLAAMRYEMEPVIETFTTLRTLGKWVAVGIAFVGSLTAIVAGWREIFKK